MPHDQGQVVSRDGELREQLVESEKLMQEHSLTWEQKEKQTEQIHQVWGLKLIYSFFLTSNNLL